MIAVEKAAPRRVGDEVAVFLAADAAERCDDGVKVGHGSCLAAPQRGKSEGRQLFLQRTEVMTADSQIEGEIQSAVFKRTALNALFPDVEHGQTV